MTDSIKTVFLGGGGVGKSSIILRIVRDDFFTAYDPTIETNYVKRVSYLKRDYILEILDTAGQEEYQVLIDQQIGSGDIFVIVCSGLSRNSLTDYVPFYLEKVREKKEGGRCIVVCNKVDLKDECEIDGDYCQEYLNSMGFNVNVIEVSARTKIGVGDLIQGIVTEHLLSNDTRGKRLIRSSKGFKKTRSLEQLVPHDSYWKKMKVVIVGEENVGKTHLCHGLRKTKYKKNMSTDGIDIHKMVSDGVEIQFYDFGGQEVYYPTHTFFLTSKAIYLIVYNANRFNADRVAYWLQTITSMQNFDQNNSIIFTVGTHADLIDKTDEFKRTSEIKKLPNAQLIKNNYFLSCKDSNGIRTFRKLLKNFIFNHPILKMKTDSDTITLSNILESREEKYMTFDQFYDISNPVLNNSLNISDFEEAAQFLHNTGTIIWFNNPSLRNLVILNPQWLADVFSTLVTTKISGNGSFDPELLSIIWKEREDTVDTYIKILQKFDILYSIDDKIYVPCIFPALKPDKYHQVEQEYKEYDTANFDFYERLFNWRYLPSLFFPRICIRLLYESIKPDTKVVEYWKRGIIFKKQNELCILTLAGATIKLSVRTPKNESPAALLLITDVINSVSSTLTQKNYLFQRD
eukprot:TRINITY_DN2888_c0_g1_i1.p1 TRINITY_DN2888_c0_g1~~TRINITY_DN2888_c0_g1_i1.p1  ORF type:complete len:630 (+),score=111.13 TRINITY_DN2888_c0_g1_i1:99-1988(+)